MKTMKLIIPLAIVAFAAAVVACNKNASPMTARGVVIDATMNTLMLQGMQTADTLVVSTIDAEHIGSGILLGDVAEVTYTPSNKESLATASKIEILSADRQNSPLLGEWVEPNPIDPDSWQGVEIGEGGAASSIGMATLQYMTWTPWEDKLILTGQSIGNGQTIDFFTMFTVVEVSADKLTLEADGVQTNYVRMPTVAE